MTPELARYLHGEYGVNESFARSAVGRAGRAQIVRVRYGPAEWVRRLWAAVAGAFVAARASPGEA